jgi:hypothetical protein
MGTMFLADGPTQYFGGSTKTLEVPRTAYLSPESEQ